MGLYRRITVQMPRSTLKIYLMQKIIDWNAVKIAHHLAGSDRRPGGVRRS